MRRFLIGAGAAAAVLASGAAPAQAHHDEVCAPPPQSNVCVRGLQHIVPDTRAFALATLDALHLELRAAVADGYERLDALPASVCVVGPLCIVGIRELAQATYAEATDEALWAVYGWACTALQHPNCPSPLPPI